MAHTADSARLRKLTRPQLQSLAKREGVRAIGKTEDIIRRLLQKRVGGVPIPDDADNPSASSAPLERILPGKTRPTMDSSKLHELTRTQLQSLAKREGIRAVGKTADIIQRLTRKHPGGVPVPEDVNNPSTSSASLKQSVLKTPLKGIPSLSPVPDTSTDHKGKGKQVAEATSPSPSSSTEALVQLLYPEDEPVAGPSNTNSTPQLESEMFPDHPISFSRDISPVPLPVHPSLQAHSRDNSTHSDAASPQSLIPGWLADEEDGSEDGHVDIDYPKGAPNHYMVLDTLRQFTTLVNAIPSMETRIAESRCLLKRAEVLLDKATPDTRELVVTREYLETFLLGKMKQKRELWDGTAKMNKQDRKLRMEWLRAERRAANEKKWRETNELYRRHGLKPEPLSAFASESDEEVIESLQTTPTSSRDGSSKRTRDESVGRKSDGDADSDGERRRKRTRT